jgi:hypothetical protein
MNRGRPAPACVEGTFAMRTAMPSSGSFGRRVRKPARLPARAGAHTEHLENRLLFATYNALSDFSTAANPNGVWTYGESTNGTFTQDTGVSGNAWGGAGSGNFSSVGTNSQAPGLVLKPGQTGASADLRWTAPADGTYSITGNFNDFAGHASDDVRVLVNGVSVSSGTVGVGGLTDVPVTQNALLLNSGNTVDFVVGPGSDGWDSGDAVSLQATIAASTGGTTNTSPLATTVSGRLPTKTLVAGERVTPAFYQRVTLTNNGSTTVTGPVSINLVLGNTPTGEAGDQSVASISRRVNLRAGRSIRFPVLVRSFPPGVSGDEYIVAKVTDPTSLTSTGASSTTIALRPAFVDLSGAFGATPRRVTPGRRLLLPVIVTNAGNIQAKGDLQIDVVATSSGATVDLGVVTKRIVLNPARRQRYLLVETTPSNMPAGTYTLTGTVDPNHTLNDVTVTNDTFTSPIPLVIA